MLDTLAVIGAAFGGLGLFILAIGMMTDGLKLAAGASLRTLLSKWSRTPLRGIFAGMLMTGIVQSSSAVTVASIGFVNAGLIKMRQALGIIYGANIGTTMTGWLVALTGFKLNLQALALPIIGAGMLLKLSGSKYRFGSVGVALVGFGLFFVGVDVLKTAFEDVVQLFDLSRIDVAGPVGILSFLGVGIVMTILTQSSSASIALTITAASSGVVGLSAAAAMVIGANVGTTSTAVIASIGATSNAKRVAAVQVIFNVATGCVAFVVMPLMFWFIGFLNGALDIQPRMEITLALFHTIFNIMGVVLIYPLNNRLASFVERRFVSWEETESHPRFLDTNVAATPVLAVNALVLELESIGDRVSRIYSRAIEQPELSHERIENELRVVNSLSSQVARFIVNIERLSLSESTTEQLSVLMRVDQYLANCAMSVRRISDALAKREMFQDELLETNTQRFFRHVLAFMNGERLSIAVDISKVENAFHELVAEHDLIKSELLYAGTREKISIHQMTAIIESMSEAMRMAQHWLKAEQRLNWLQLSLNVGKGEKQDDQKEGDESADDALIHQVADNDEASEGLDRSLDLDGSERG